MPAVAVCFPDDGDESTGRCVLHGVENQVGEGAAQLAFVAPQQMAIANADVEFVALFAAEGLGVVADLLDHRL